MRRLPDTVGKRGGSAPPFGSDIDYLSADTGQNDDGIRIQFDMGTSLRHEYIRLEIPPTDFAPILAEMFNANRRAFLDAVAQALLAYPDKEPS